LQVGASIHDDNEATAEMEEAVASLLLFVFAMRALPELRLIYLGNTILTDPSSNPSSLFDQFQIALLMSLSVFDLVVLSTK